MKKYGFTGEQRTLVMEGRPVVRRIVAVRNFKDVSVGDKGGFVESESNLSHDGDAWVDEEAVVYGNALVSENAYVTNSAVVCGNARISGNAKLLEEAYVSDNAVVTDNAVVNNFAVVCGDAVMSECAIACDFALIRSKAKMKGKQVAAKDMLVEDDIRRDKPVRQQVGVKNEGSGRPIPLGWVEWESFGWYVNRESLKFGLPEGWEAREDEDVLILYDPVGRKHVFSAHVPLAALEDFVIVENTRLELDANKIG